PVSGNQLGQLWGGDGRTGCSGQDCPTSNQAQGTATDMIQVSQLYLRWIKDYQELVIGRAPLHFGLGTTYNEGNGLFDHWLTTRDLLAYRVEFGNLWIRPMIAKTAEGLPGKEDDMTEFLVHGQYDNPASGLSMGIMYSKRFGEPAGYGQGAGDVYDSTLTPSPVAKGGWNTQLINIYLSRILGDFKFGFEAGFLSGKTGYQIFPNGPTNAGSDISLDSYGLAGEVFYDLSPKFKLDAKLGMATGDDPSTTDKDESFVFHRNYDVGILLFNYALGNANSNVLGTNRYTRANTHSFDGDSVANTLYFAPGFHWIWNEAWGLKGRLIYAKLMQARTTGMDTALGFEFDTSIIHKPMERLELRLDLAVMAPGNAYQVNGAFKNQTAFGLMTKAAITF
ncbi:MAG: hypothetical protein K2X47_02590, partial [Bdellovibrionales bacterium]|nr:hypothetical protein [Bdellovibrionales bacterium]